MCDSKSGQHLQEQQKVENFNKIKFFFGRPSADLLNISQHTAKPSNFLFIICARLRDFYFFFFIPHHVYFQLDTSTLKFRYHQKKSSTQFHFVCGAMLPQLAGRRAQKREENGQKFSNFSLRSLVESYEIFFPF